ncbi:putative membrane protein [Mobilisporobacter senegalensis]|uniref:Putative membrane protein n=2 Tax=Mobilisporobacter senegalensis TaxID=1329262 RepID=A0A3N1XG05_9FIRM|nr:putative membrane protein [Mobilisporobacter senegalensis]
MLKGFIIGSSMSVPGVSGGTMAILLGIYDKLISSISNFLKDIKGNILFLMKFCIGSFVGIGSLAFVIKWLLEEFPLPVSFFFLGAVIGGIPALYKKTKESSLRISSVIYFLIGLILVISIGFLPVGNFDVSSGTGVTHFLMLLVTGIIIALALVLPGISTSHMLLVLGMYDTMLIAITKFDVVYIGILGISTVIGIFLITKPIEWTLNKFPHQTYCMIIGFVLGSTSEIFRDKIIPAIPADANIRWWISSILISIVTFVLGYYAIMSLSRFSNE